MVISWCTSKYTMILPGSFQGQVSGEACICHLHDTGAFFALHGEATQMCECRDTDTAKLFHLSLQWRSLLSAVPRQSLWNVSSPLRFLLTITINVLPPATLRLRFSGMTSSYPTSCLASHESKHHQTRTQWTAEFPNLFAFNACHLHYATLISCVWTCAEPSVVGVSVLVNQQMWYIKK